MPFYRFDEIEDIVYMTPRLSSGHGPIIEGQYMSYCLNCKEAGTGSQIHYHPNELLIFPLQGSINSLVGRDRRVVRPGTFIHIPPFGRHQMLATEDGPLSYIYVKDKTWSVVGVGADEALPERAQTIDEVKKEYEQAGWEAGKGVTKKTEGKSAVIIDGLGNCYYSILKQFDEPASSGNRHYSIGGKHLDFCFSEYLTGTNLTWDKSSHEVFIYVIYGSMHVTLEGEKKIVSCDDIIHIPKGAAFQMSVMDAECVRYVSISSSDLLEKALA